MCWVFIDLFSWLVLTFSAVRERIGEHFWTTFERVCLFFHLSKDANFRRREKIFDVIFHAIHIVMFSFISSRLFIFVFFCLRSLSRRFLHFHAWQKSNWNIKQVGILVSVFSKETEINDKFCLFVCVSGEIIIFSVSTMMILADCDTELMLLCQNV